MKVMFSTNTVHARDRLEYWREEASKAYVAHEFNSEVGRSFQGKIHAGALGPLQLAVFHCDPCRVERTARCLKRADDDGVIIGMQIAGSMGVRQDGRDFVAKADDLYLIDPRRPFTLDVRGDARSMVVKAPRGEVTARLGDTASLTARPICGRKPVGSLATGFIAMLGARVDTIKGPAATKIAQQALDLVALAFDEDVNGKTPRLSSPRTTTALRLKSTHRGAAARSGAETAGRRSSGGHQRALRQRAAVAGGDFSGALYHDPAPGALPPGSHGPGADVSYRNGHRLLVRLLRRIAFHAPIQIAVRLLAERMPAAHALARTGRSSLRPGAGMLAPWRDRETRRRAQWRRPRRASPCASVR